MTKFKGTPGPWELNDYTDAIIDPATGATIATLSDGGHIDPDVEVFDADQIAANGAAIAALPDLLEVVEAMATFSGRNNNTHLKQMAREALAKAYGLAE